MVDGGRGPGGGAALIIGDVQVGILEAFGWTRVVLAPLTELVARARAQGVPIVFVRVALRPDRADVPSHSPVVNWMFDAGELFREASPQTAVHPDLAPRDTDPVVTKRRASAFTGTDLDAVLRARGITEVAIAGVATTGVVLATLVDALERDLAVTVLRDCCADAEPDVHDFLMDRVFPGRGARVVSSRDWAGDG